MLMKNSGSALFTRTFKIGFAFLLITSATFISASPVQAQTRAGENADAARFPILNNDMGEYWSLKNAKAHSSTSAVNSEAVNIFGEAGVQNGQGVSHGVVKNNGPVKNEGTGSANEVGTNEVPQNHQGVANSPITPQDIFSARQPQSVGSKKKDLPSQVSPRS